MRGSNIVLFGNGAARSAAGGGASPVTESFNKADSATLGPDLTWSELQGDWAVVSNEAKIQSPPGSPQGTIAEAVVDMASADHYAQVVASASGDAQVGVIVRLQDVQNLYFAYWRGGSDVWRIAKYVGGTFTQLAETAGPTSLSGVTIRLEVSGSDLELFVDDVSTLTANDSSHTGLLRTGIFAAAALTSSVDNFEAGPV